MKRSRIRPGARAALACLVAGAIGAVGLGAGTAGAAGISLAQYLVGAPSGFAAVSPATDQALAQQVESSERSGFAQPLTAAVAEFLNGAEQIDVAITVLQSAQAFDSATAVQVACNATVQTGASNTTAINGISGSAIGTCDGLQSGNQVIDAYWSESNVIAFVAAVGVDENTVAAVAQSEAALIPAGGIPFSSVSSSSNTGTATTAAPPASGSSSSSSSSGSTTDVVIGAVTIVVVVGLVVALVLVLRSRRRKDKVGTVSVLGGPPTFYGQAPAPAPTQAPAPLPAPAPAPVPVQEPNAPPGSLPDAGDGWNQQVDAATLGGYPADWYTVDGQPGLMRYWDGSGWQAQRRWNGSAWVDEPVS